MTHTRRFRSKKNRTMKKRHMKNKTRRGGENYVGVESHFPGHMPPTTPSYYDAYKASYLPKDHGRKIHVEKGHPNYVEPKKQPSLFTQGWSAVGNLADKIAYGLTRRAYIAADRQTERNTVRNTKAKMRDDALGKHIQKLMRESGIRKQRNLRLSSMSHQAPPSVVNE